MDALDSSPASPAFPQMSRVASVSLRGFVGGKDGCRGNLASRGWAFAAALLAGVVVFAQGIGHPAIAAPSRHVSEQHGFTLEWDAPPTCPSAEEVRALVAQFTGDQEPQQQQEEFAARGRVRHVSGRWTLEASITTGQVPHTRTLASHDCVSVTRAFAAIVAVSLAPFRVADQLGEPASNSPGSVPLPPSPATLAPRKETSEPIPRTEPLPPSPSVGRDLSSQSPPREDSPSAQLNHFLRVSGGVGYGLLPSAGPVVDVTYAGGRTRWRVEASLAYLPPRRVTYAGTTFGATIQAATAAVRGCATPQANKFIFPLCAGLHGGAAIAAGYQAANTSRTVAPWGAGSLSASATWRLHRVVAPYLGAEGLVHMTRPAFHIGEREPVFRSTRVAVRVSAGLEFHFP